VASLLDYEYDTTMKTWNQLLVPTLESNIVVAPLSLTNSATGKVEPVLQKSLYRMYICGITPYDATHIGHAATYLTFDLINRYLRASGSEVRYVQNITDIDDPLLERAKRDGVDWTELAHKQIDLFRGDMQALRVIPPQSYIGAVEAIPLVVDSIQVLKEKSSVYLVDSDLYFKVSSDPHFGERSHLSQEKMLEIFAERGGDPQRLGKLDPLDCLVWMSQRPDEPGWDSLLGVGRPGWHIECTAIAIKYLEPDSSNTPLIDIQGGGSDLIFPHHEMCAAQAQVMTGRALATSYVHGGMIGLDGEKMSKSKGNLVFVSQLVAQGTDPMAIRWALMKHHYRLDRMWTEQLLSESEFEISQLRQVLNQEFVAPFDQLLDSIVGSVANDLDTPTVLSEINRWVRDSQTSSTHMNTEPLVQILDSLLGIKL
jgi:L-cysteine:1D-myo-inositol 2-amino-2-deoxy-alpha-D-glucopyranoside ligase